MVLQRRLPPRLGGDRVFVSPDSSLSYWRRNLDLVGKDLFDFAEEFVREGDVVWDVGANVGMFTFASAFCAGSSGCVVAIEPDIFLVDLLRMSAASMSENRAKVVILPAAASESLCIADFHIAKRGRSANYIATSIGSSQTGGVRETVSVIAITLDWLMERLPLPRVLKIDVETAEAIVLAGAEQLLSKAKPVILCEVSEENQNACTRILKSHGYSFFNFENRLGGKIEMAAWSTLAIVEG
jgi:FkbM family methyltransferase